MDTKKVNAYKQLIEENLESFDLISIDRSKVEDITHEIQELSEFGLKAIGILAGHKNVFFKNKLDEHILKLKSEGEAILKELHEINNEILRKIKKHETLEGKAKENLEEEVRLLILKKQELISKTNSKRFTLERNSSKIHTEFTKEKIQLEKLYEEIKNGGGKVKMYSFFVGLFFAFLSFLTENIIIGEFKSQNLNWADYTGFLINFGIGIFTYEIAKGRIENYFLKKHIAQAKNIVANLYDRQKERTKMLGDILRNNLK